MQRYLILNSAKCSNIQNTTDDADCECPGSLHNSYLESQCFSDLTKSTQSTIRVKPNVFMIVNGIDLDQIFL